MRTISYYDQDNETLEIIPKEETILFLVGNIMHSQEQIKFELSIDDLSDLIKDLQEIQKLY